VTLHHIKEATGAAGKGHAGAGAVNAALAKLRQTVESFRSYIRSLPPEQLAPAAWGPPEVLVHLVFWHETFVSTQALLDLGCPAEGLLQLRTAIVGAFAFQQPQLVQLLHDVGQIRAKQQGTAVPAGVLHLDVHQLPPSSRTATSATSRVRAACPPQDPPGPERPPRAVPRPVWGSGRRLADAAGWTFSSAALYPPGRAGGGSGWHNDLVSRPLWAIFLTILVNLIGFGIVIPLLPFYARSLGASPLQVGLLFASYSACQLVAAPLLGAWSDRWGRRPVLLVSLAGTAVSFALLAVGRNLPTLFAARVVDGLSGGNISTARAYIADVTPEGQRARSFGLIGAAFGVGFVVGPALGGALSHFGYAAPAWAAVGLTVAAMALAWRWLPETVHRVRAAGPSPWRQLPVVLRRPGLRALLAVDFVYWATAAVVQTTFALFVSQRFGLDPSHTGYLLAVWGAVGAAVQVGLVSPVVRRWGELPVLTGGLLVAGLGLLGASASRGLWVFVVSTLAAGVGAGLSNPALVSLISRSAAAHEQGAVQGVAGALESLGRMVGPVWGNGVLGAVGEGASFASAGVGMVMAGLAAAAMRPGARTKRPKGR